MKEIKVGRDSFALVDDCNFEELSKSKWHLLRHRTGNLYAYKRENGKVILMHRYLLNVKEFIVKVDHKDGNGLNNQMHNLRRSTNSQNMMNRGKASHNKSGYKGVSKEPGDNANLWRAQITIAGKCIFIGCFNTPKEAAHAYNEKAKELHGEFAYLNKI